MLFNILPPVIFILALAVLIIIVGRKLPKVAQEKEPEIGELEKVEATAKARAKQFKERGRKIGRAVTGGMRSTGKLFLRTQDKVAGLLKRRKKASLLTKPLGEEGGENATVTLADEPMVSQQTNGAGVAEKSTATLLPEPTQKLTPAQDAQQREFKRLLDEGNIYLQNKNYESAEKSYIRAASVDPQSLDVYLGLGEIYLTNSNFEDALNAYQEVLRLDADNVTAYTKLGEVFLKQDKFDDAVEAYHKAQKIEPEQAQIAAGLAQALTKAGQPKKAMKYYREALEREPGNESYKIGLAEAALANDDQEIAEALVTEILKNNPEQVAAKKIRERLTALAAEKK